MLIGDSNKVFEKLGWKARTQFNELVRIMVKSDLLQKGLDPSEFMISLDAEV
jgi:GDP-D-mannose dehydratase